MNASNDRTDREFSRCRRRGWGDLLRGGAAIFAVIASASGWIAGPANAAEGYVISDDQVARNGDAGVYGDSILVQPNPSGSFESLVDGEPQSKHAVNVDDDAWIVSGCESCGGAGCTSCSGHGGCGTGGGWFNRILGPACPRWVLQVDALMLWQGNIASRPLLLGPTGTVLDVNQTQTAMAAGPRFGLFCNLDETYAIEGNYFNVGIFPGDAPFTPAGTYTAVNLPPPVALPATPTAYNLFSQARIQSAELNWRRRDCHLPITWLAGFRWVEWNQVLQFSDAALPPMTGTTSTTGNDLYGGQIGADLGLWDAGRWLRIDGVGKAGVFYNTAYQRSYGIVDQQGSSTLLGPTSAVAQQTSFFGEVGANATVRVCRWLSWRVGYSVFWLSAVAVPADQLALTSLTPPPGTATINTNGSVLLHGVTTGLEARW